MLPMKPPTVPAEAATSPEAAQSRKVTPDAELFPAKPPRTEPPVVVTEPAATQFVKSVFAADT